MDRPLGDGPAGSPSSGPLQRADPTPLLLGAGWFPDEPGGLNRYFRELLLVLGADGRPPPAVVVGPVSDPPPGLVATERAPLPLRLWRYGAIARGLRESADLIDSHFALYGFAALLAGVAQDRPLVVHFHGPWAQEGVSAGGSRLRSAAKRTVERRVYRRGALAVTLSGSFKRLLVEQYGVEPWKVAVVSPAVDLRRFVPGDRLRARESLGLPAGGKVVVSVRRLVPRMGLETLLDAWSRLDPGAGRRLLVVGEGSERGRLEGLAGELGIAEAVSFLGRVGEDELVTCYRAADLSVVPTAELEGFGLVVLESLACGTPVVTSDAGGLSEATLGLEGRIIIPAGDPERLAGALAGAFGGELALPSPAECRSHAERYAPALLAKRHREVYRRAVSPSLPRKRRVVYLDHCAQLSGAEICLLNVVKALAEIDAHVILGEEGPLEVRLREAGISTEVLALAPSAQGVARDRLSPRLGTLTGAASAVVHALRLARRLRRLSPDLVHANTLKSGFYGGLAARLAGVPLVWHLHDRLATSYMPGSAARLVRMAIERFADQVIVNSEATRATLDPAWRDRATVIPSPVELPDSPAAARDQVKRVGIVGRLAPWKGQDVFLQAVDQAFGPQNVEAVVIGAPLFGEEAYADSVRRQAKTLESDVTFSGFVEDVPAELGRLDLLVHASTIPEPFGQVVLEGMAAGLPVVAADAGGPAEIIDDGVNGLLYPPGEASALADRLRLLAGDRDLRSRLAGAARMRAGEFSPERVAGMVSGVYRAALGGGVPG